MSAWDPFATLRQEQPQPDEDKGEDSVGGGADGGAGGERHPQAVNMNDALRDLIRGGNA
jgi:hypothetical protein